MAKQFKQLTVDPKKGRAQRDEFRTLLESKKALSEKHDVQPFFKKRPQISAFIGSYMRDIGPATDYAFEYPFYGDFAADLVVGDKATRSHPVECVTFDGLHEHMDRHLRLNTRY